MKPRKTQRFQPRVQIVSLGGGLDGEGTVTDPLLFRKPLVGRGHSRNPPSLGSSGVVQALMIPGNSFFDPRAV